MNQEVKEREDVVKKDQITPVREKFIVKTEPSFWYFVFQHWSLNFATIMKKMIGTLAQRSLTSLRNSDFLQGSIDNPLYGYWQTEWNRSRNVVRFLRCHTLLHQGEYNMAHTITDYALFNVFYLFEIVFWGSYVLLRHTFSYLLGASSSPALTLMLLCTELITICRQVDSVRVKLDYKKLAKANKWMIFSLALQVILNKVAVMYLHGWHLILAFTGINLLTEFISWWWGCFNASGRLNLSYAYRKTQKLFLTSKRFRNTLAQWTKESFNLLVTSVIGILIVNYRNMFFYNVRPALTMIQDNFFFVWNLTDNIFDTEERHLELLIRNFRNTGVSRSVVTQSKKLFAAQFLVSALQFLFMYQPRLLFFATYLNNFLNKFFLGKGLNLNEMTSSNFSKVYIRHLMLEGLLFNFSWPTEELVYTLNDFPFYNEGLVNFIIDDLLPFVVPVFLFTKVSYFRAIMAQDILTSAYNFLMLPRTLRKLKEAERKKFLLNVVNPYLAILIAKIAFNYYYIDYTF